MFVNDTNRAKIIDKTSNRSGREPDREMCIQQSMAVAEPLVDELRKLGYEIKTLADLRHQGRDWKAALPILLRWFPLVNDDLDVKQEIVRCLSVPWIGNKATAELIEEFKKYAPFLLVPSNPWDGNQLRDIPEEEKRLA